MEQEWKDVTYLAILDTDYMLRLYFKAAPKSLWDELFIRHDRERSALLRWEENKARLKGSTSMETVRMSPEPQTVTAQPATEKGKGKEDYRDAYDASASEEDSDFEEVAYNIRKAHDGVITLQPSPSFGPSLNLSPGPHPSPGPSLSPSPSVNDQPFDCHSDDSADSQWDMLDVHSTDSSSNFELLPDDFRVD
jgi:hypothetical protein